jgi:hypothetical protein
MKNRSGNLAMVAVVIISNALALVVIARNRSGGPIQTIELTERELRLENRGQDSSAVFLRLNWLNRHFRPWLKGIRTEEYFDDAKLRELGFHLDKSQSDVGYSRPSPRAVFVALEYDGDLWRHWLDTNRDDLQPAGAPVQGVGGPRPLPYPRDLNRNEEMAPHLFVVDAGTNFDQLRARYPDSKKYIVVRAVVGAFRADAGGGTISPKTPGKWQGYVEELVPQSIFVPAPLARTLSLLQPQPAPSPRYSVVLMYGRNVEPWVAAVRLHKE